mmetsp:Transcript_99131/g.276045  ORF Transcript_99131/g.276045 Transcript_99131/m.276045 type:complete len:183 (-) Transcript_99131:68-616(-)
MSCCCFECLGAAPASVTFQGRRCKVKDLVGGNFSCEQLEAGGLSARELRRGGASALKSIGFSAGKMKAGGFSAAQLKAAGFDASEMKAGGYGISELYHNAYFDKEALKAAGFTARDCYNDNVSPELVSALLGKCDLKDLVAAGYGPMKLGRALGVTNQELIEAGVNVETIHANNKMWSGPAV